MGDSLCALLNGRSPLSDSQHKSPPQIQTIPAGDKKVKNEDKTRTKWTKKHKSPPQIQTIPAGNKKLNKN